MRKFRALYKMECAFCRAFYFSWPQTRLSPLVGRTVGGGEETHGGDFVEVIKRGRYREIVISKEKGGAKNFLKKFSPLKIETNKIFQVYY